MLYSSVVVLLFIVYHCVLYSITYTTVSRVRCVNTQCTECQQLFDGNLPYALSLCYHVLSFLFYVLFFERCWFITSMQWRSLLCIRRYVYYRVVLWRRMYITKFVRVGYTHTVYSTRVYMYMWCCIMWVMGGGVHCVVDGWRGGWRRSMTLLVVR